MRARNVKKCRFQVEPLEGRTPPSNIALPHHAMALHAEAVQVAPTTVPYKEFVTLVSTISTGPNTSASVFTGTATYFSSLSIITNATINNPTTGVLNQTFARIATNGDTMYGNTVGTPTGTTTGVTYTLKITVMGGTGRFRGVTGSQTGIVYVNPTTLVETADVEGTLSFPHHQGHRRG